MSALAEITVEQIQVQKTAFAEAILKTPDDPVKAAFAVIGDTGLALQAARTWLTDPFVVSEKLRLLKERGERAFLPTKEDQAKDIYKIANDPHVDEDNRLKAHRLYAEIMNHIEKPATAGNTTQILNQGVMIVRDHGTDDDWEHRAIEQQRTLIANA